MWNAETEARKTTKKLLCSLERKPTRQQGATQQAHYNQKQEGNMQKVVLTLQEEQ